MGGTVTFMCNSESVLKWDFLNHTTIPYNVIVSGPLNRILTIKNVRAVNTGMYQCKHGTKSSSMISYGRLKVLETERPPYSMQKTIHLYVLIHFYFKRLLLF